MMHARPALLSALPYSSLSLFDKTRSGQVQGQGSMFGVDMQVILSCSCPAKFRVNEMIFMGGVAVRSHR